MRTRKIYGGLVMTAAALLCLAGCKKDDEGEKITLGTQFEKAVSAQKTYLGENNYVCWSTGDQVNVNGTECEVSAEGVEVDEDESYYAVYPAEGSDVNATGGTVVIPATQTYTQDEQSGRQVLNGPMAARLDGKSGTLYFRNLYSLLKVTVAADDKNFTVNSITVTATGENPKALAGTQSFKFNGATNTVENLELTDLTNSSTTVTLTCGSTTVNANTDQDFYLVVHPMAAQNLTVKVKGVLDGKMVVYTYNTLSERTLNRSRIGGLAVNLQQLNPVITGRFTVNSEGKQVEFAPGNLQYLACNSTAGDLKHQTVEGEANGMFRFAEHQYDYIGSANSNISSSYNGWIDLFGWGTSGYNEKYPYMTIQTNTKYGAGESDIAETNYDWGVYNEIQSFDGNTIYPKGTWRTLTNAEWYYLTRTRDNASNLRRYGVTVCDKSNCLIIAPDGFTGTIDASYDASAWSAAEAAGLVCLPAAGYRDGTSVTSAGSIGYYWSSTYYYGDYAYSLGFNSGYAFPNGDCYMRYFGHSVRLVKNVE